MQDCITYIVEYPVTNFLSYHQLSLEYYAFPTTISNTHEPNNFLEAQSQAV